MVSGDEMLQIHQQTPKNVGVLLDFAHLKVSSNAHSSFDLIDETRKIASKARGFHLSDNDGFMDTNSAFDMNTWFWEFIPSDAKYVTVEVYTRDKEALSRMIKICFGKMYPR